MLSLLRLSERHGHVRGMLLLSIAMLVLSVAGVTLLAIPAVLYLALWLYFVAVNYLEASLPSLVSKAVFPGGKGTALGVYSTSQFIGAFCGGASGGWVMQQGGVHALFLLCLVPGLLWIASSWRLVAAPRAQEAAARG